MPRRFSPAISFGDRPPEEAQVVPLDRRGSAGPAELALRAVSVQEERRGRGRPAEGPDLPGRRLDRGGEGGQFDSRRLEVRPMDDPPAVRPGAEGAGEGSATEPEPQPIVGRNPLVREEQDGGARPARCGPPGLAPHDRVEAAGRVAVPDGGIQDQGRSGQDRSR
ncbi:MAG: hypothetical protein JWO38_2681 [Gemmataceae bacterium]|nr:hypothetical protein [Gemmataceae bacterium]